MLPYPSMMAPRVIELRRVMKLTATLYPPIRLVPWRSIVARHLLRRQCGALSWATVSHT